MDKKERIRTMARRLNVFVNQNLKIFSGKDPSTRELVKHCRDIDHLHDYLESLCKNKGIVLAPEVEVLSRDYSGEDGTLAKAYSKTYTPFDHQIAYFNRAKDKSFFANFSEMGTGKTIMELMVTGYLYDKGEIEALVILAPNGVHRQWVIEAIPEHLVDGVNPKCAVWSSKTTRNYKMYLERFVDLEHNGLKVLSMNIEALGSNSKRATDYIFNFMEKHHCHLVVDESTRIKSPKAKRTKVVLQLGKLSKYRRILSGLYAPNGPLDLYPQFYFLHPDILGHKSFVTFKSRYTIERNPRLHADLAIAVEDKKLGELIYKERLKGYVTPNRLYSLMKGYDDEKIQNVWKILRKSFLFIADYKNVDELADKIEPYSFRVLKEECIDLPEKLFQQYTVEMSPEQVRLYESIEEELLAEIDDQGTELIADHVLKKLGYMRQICGGTYRTEDEQFHIIEGKIPRLEKMMEVIGDIDPGRKIIIWACYRAEVEMIRQRLEKDEIGYAQVHGGITGEPREEEIKRFKEDPFCRVLVGTAASGGIGRNLAIAKYMIFYSNSFELEERRQAEDRIHRIGQDVNVTIIDLYQEDKIDHQIFKSLINKQSIADMITRDVLCWKPEEK